MFKYILLALLIPATLFATATRVIDGQQLTNATATLTFPSSTDTIVGRATTDTLTNKSISGSTNTFTNIDLTTSVGSSILPVANGGTNSSSFTAGSLVFAGASGTSLTQDNSGIFYDDPNNRLGLGIATPQQQFHIDAGTGIASLMQFTNGATTGQTSTDGFVVGISSGGVAQIRNREATNMQFFTNNLQAFSIMSNGNVGIQNNTGSQLATTDTTGFFYISSSAGTPTGVASTFNGGRPIHIDSTNSKFYFYSGGWISPASAVGTLGAGNANGFDITAGVATLHAATSTQPGAVSATTQTMAGNKTFLGSVETETSLILEDPGAGTNTTTIQAGVPTTSYTLTLPVDDGTTNQCLKTDGSGVTSWGACGSTSGADNYIINPNATVNTNNVTASGGSLTRNTTTPLYGVADFAIDLSASAQTVTWDSNAMDPYLKYGNCQGSFYYKGDASLYKAYVTVNSIKVSQEIQLTNESVSTASRPVTLVFPCGDLSFVAKVVIEATDNSAAAINVGKVFVGEAGLISVGTETGWSQYTPTFTQFGTVTVQSFWWKRIGDSLYIHGRFTTGTTGASEARISLPSVFVTSSNIATLQVFGKYGRSTATTASHGGFVTVAPSVAYVNFSNFEVFGSGTVTAIGAAVGTSVAGNTEVLSVQAGPIPIQGWSSSVSAVPADQTDFGWRNCTNNISSPTAGLGTITSNSCKIRRKGEFAEINQDITVGTRTATEARLALPDGLVLDAAYPSLQPCMAGDVLVAATTTVDYMVQCTASLNYITFGYNENVPTGGSVAQLGNAIFADATRIKINYMAKISGWVENQKAPILVSSVTSSSSTVAERIIYGNVTGSNCTASFTSGGVTLSGTRTGDGTGCTLTFSPAFAVEPACTYKTKTSNTCASANSVADTTSAVRVAVRVCDVGGSGNDSDVDFICIGPR